MKVSGLVAARLISASVAVHDPRVSDVIRLLVVDDHASFRAAVTDMVAGDARFSVVGDADSGEAAVAVAASTPCDVVVMDVRMPGMGGVAAVAAIRRIRPEAVVLLVSIDAVPQRQLVGRVASAFVPKLSLTTDVLLGVWSARHESSTGGDGEDVRDVRCASWWIVAVTVVSLVVVGTSSVYGRAGPTAGHVSATWWFVLGGCWPRPPSCRPPQC